MAVLSEIDVSATLHNKLGVELRAYRILGGHNPQLPPPSATSRARDNVAVQVVVQMLLGWGHCGRLDALTGAAATERDKLLRALARCNDWSPPVPHAQAEDMSSLQPITQALILVNGLAFLVKPVLAACSRRNIYPDRPLLFLR